LAKKLQSKRRKLEINPINFMPKHHNVVTRSASTAMPKN
jgi:hypothetical protein